MISTHGLGFTLLMEVFALAVGKVFQDWLNSEPNLKSRKGEV